MEGRNKGTRRRFFALFLSLAVGLQLLVMPASAALSTDYPEDEPAEISISQQEIDALYSRLAISLREENERLRESLRRLEEENEILRRAAGSQKGA